MAWNEHDLQTIGYFPKRPQRRPDWLVAPQVEWVCSVSNCDCATQSPEDWIQQWLHNPPYVFDTLASVDRVLPVDAHAEFLRYGLRTLPVQFTETGEAPFVIERVDAEPIPSRFRRLGYDVCNRSDNVLECSPLSCNGLAKHHPVNRLCLLDTLQQAIAAAERFGREQPEPGAYVVLEVWAEHEPG